VERDEDVRTACFLALDVLRAQLGDEVLREGARAAVRLPRGTSPVPEPPEGHLPGRRPARPRCPGHADLRPRPVRGRADRGRLPVRVPRRAHRPARQPGSAGGARARRPHRVLRRHPPRLVPGALPLLRDRRPAGGAKRPRHARPHGPLDEREAVPIDSAV